MNNDDKIIFGVCQALANYVDVDVLFIRFAFITLFYFFPISSILLYMLLYLIMDNDN